MRYKVSLLREILLLLRQYPTPGEEGMAVEMIIKELEEIRSVSSQTLLSINSLPVKESENICLLTHTWLFSLSFDAHLVVLSFI